MNYDSWMRRALEVAYTSPPGPDGQIGAVVYDPQGVELATGSDNREPTDDPTASAAITALRRAATQQGNWRLDGCTLVTTREPDPMECGAIVLARIPRLVMGSWDDQRGAVCSQWDLVRDRRLNHYVEVFPEVLKDDCDALQSS